MAQTSKFLRKVLAVAVILATLTTQVFASAETLAGFE